MPASPPPSPPSRASRLPPRLAALALGLLAAPLLAEAGARVLFGLLGSPWDAAVAREAVDRLRRENGSFVPVPQRDVPFNPNDGEKSRRSLHPYLGWEISGGLQQLDDELMRARGSRAGRAFDVLLLGGSVAQIFGQLGEPAILARLHEDPRFAGREIHLIKFGRGGFKQPQQLLFLGYLLALGLRPDAVVCLDGFNEVALGNNNAALGTHPVFPSVPHWAALALEVGKDPESLDQMAEIRAVQRSIEGLAGSLLEGPWLRSAILGRLGLQRLRALRARRGAARERLTAHLTAPEQDVHIRGPTYTADLAKPVFVSVRSWRESSRSLRDLCRGRGITYLHVLQPTLHDPGSKPASEEETSTGRIDPRWMRGVVEGYPLLRQAGAQLRNDGVEFLDASRLFASIEETLYFDNCHFGERGCEILGVAVAEALLTALPATLPESPKGH